MFAVFIVGSAGSGKTMLSHDLVLHLQGNLKRSTSLYNLDPGVKETPATFSITDHTSTASVMEEYELGPNGGVIRCVHDALPSLLLEIEQVSTEWCIVDVPGQIELFTNYNYINDLADKFVSCGYTVVIVLVTAGASMLSKTSLVSGIVTSTATRAKLEFPFFNYVSQCTPEVEQAIEDLEKDTSCPFQTKLVEFIQETNFGFSLVDVEELVLLIDQLE